jgi:hypothetical protein
MKRPFHSPAHAERGIALVIILGFVVLLTVLVVAYFSYCALQRQISHASVNQSAVEIFAEGAMATITGDLKQEIAAGSEPYEDADGTAVANTYFPKSPLTAVPDDQGVTRSYDTARLENDGLNNLLKRSAGGQPFYGGTGYDEVNFPAPNRAAALPTTTPSANGRYLSLARWNTALLLPKATPGSARDLTPTAKFTAPDWILVARDGSNPKTWNDNLRWSNTAATAVVGRYAYAIYDIGGLLDVNAAGYPPGSQPDLVGPKGSLAFADLAAIPDLSSNAIAALVGWRNYASAEPAGSFPGYTFDVAAQTRYFDSVRLNRTGFLEAAAPQLRNGKTDRLFVSRQQLIRFMTQGVATSDPERAQAQNALQYLGTFSRELNQPSFRPDPDRPKNTTHQWVTSTSASPGYGGNDAYDATGLLQNRINPEMLAVRDPSNPQEPRMKRRFPLSRLALVKPNPSAEEADQIKLYFGLEWDNSASRWVYDHGDPNQIYKLSEIPDGREPDFFETLKAVINCDSLGKQHGRTEDSTSGNMSVHQYTNNAAGVDGVVNYQLIRIGANIIDQYDADSYPTAIEFGTPARLFCGVENIPYLAGWTYSWYRMRRLQAADIDPARQPPDGVFPYESWAMYQPILWNPHAPDSKLDTAKTPTVFRVTAGSRTGIGVTIHPWVRPAWWTSTAPVNTYPAASAGTGLTPASWSQATLDPQVSQLRFMAAANTAGGVAASFQEPYRLLYNYPDGTNADTESGYTAGKIKLDVFGSIADPVLAAADAVADGSTVIGFFAGKAWTGPSTTTISGATPSQCLSSGYPSTYNVQLALQYQDTFGNWQTYDVINQVYASSVNFFSTVDNLDSDTRVRATVNGFRADPRTDRWGLFNMKTFPLAAATNGLTAPSNNGIHTNDQVYHWPRGTTLSPGAGTSNGTVYRLKLNASGKPQVDWPNTDPYLSDLMVNLMTGTSGSYIPGRKYWYNDPDHVNRRASGGWMTSTTASNSKDGLPLATGNYASRPVVLNRPFRSVAELGYTFSDTPWRELNFMAQESGDVGLLDAFCLTELEETNTQGVVAGRVNLNSRQPKVLEAVIRGSAKSEGIHLTDQEARSAAEALVKWTTADPADAANLTAGIFHKGPLRNRSELVGKFVSKVAYGHTPLSSNTPNVGYEGRLSYSGYSSALTAGANGVFLSAGAQTDGRDASAIKARRESVIRALADSGNARTWNLLVDLVAQVGRYPANAGALGKFVVEGETHQWIHLAIDRPTGQVIAKLVEPVSE